MDADATRRVRERRQQLRLVIEAATPEASVAVLRHGLSAGSARATMRPGAEEALMPAVDRAMREAGVRPADLDAVACGAGPGGFTSLRIAAAIAKGIAHATGCVLEAYPSLALFAAWSGPGSCLATLDALRGERYAARVAFTGSYVTGYEYLGVLDAAAVARAAAECDSVLDANSAHPVAALLTACLPLVTPVDLDTWEPLYGRLAEAQARWEVAHGRPLATAVAPDALS